MELRHAALPQRERGGRTSVRGVRCTGAGLKLSLKPDAWPRKTERRRAERRIFQRVAAARASQGVNDEV